MKTKVIKLYQNNKLFDTDTSCYLTLENILEYVQQGVSFFVLDNKSKRDITREVLVKVLFNLEMKNLTLNENELSAIIKNGGISNFLRQNT